MKNKNLKSFLDIIENQYKNKKINQIMKVGDFVEIGYKLTEGEKERLQFYNGLIIGQQNRGLGKSFTIRRIVEGIGIEQIFVLHSPRLEFIRIKNSSKVKRAKLYFLRSLVKKTKRLLI